MKRNLFLGIAILTLGFFLGYSAVLWLSHEKENDTKLLFFDGSNDWEWENK